MGKKSRRSNKQRRRRKLIYKRRVTEKQRKMAKRHGKTQGSKFNQLSKPCILRQRERKKERKRERFDEIIGTKIRG